VVEAWTATSRSKFKENGKWSNELQQNCQNNFLLTTKPTKTRGTSNKTSQPEPEPAVSILPPDTGPFMLEDFRKGGSDTQAGCTVRIHPVYLRKVSV
jgi:hypothetical protein